MSNMTQNQRAQFERATYAGSAERIRRGSERGASIYSAIALVIGVALSIAAVSIIEGWWQWLVLGVIVLTTIGFMIAISPNRRGW
jgi:VIT1/CCC1 family predicted Fe2+/Mn2+ transporter